MNLFGEALASSRLDGETCVMHPPKERPVILLPHEVKGILEGRQTQFRRAVKAMPGRQSTWLTPEKLNLVPHGAMVNGGWQMHHPLAGKVHSGGIREPEDSPFGWVRSPFGAPGDRLWVRETFWSENESCDHEMCGGCDWGHILDLGPEYCDVDYCSSSECENPPALRGRQTIVPHDGPPVPGRWCLSPPTGWDGKSDDVEVFFMPWTFWTRHSSAVMPRWASRITLEVVSVRVQRLHDISRSDARAEGFLPGPPDLSPEDEQYDYGNGYTSARVSFMHSLHARKGAGALNWEANPWVWAVEFKRLEETS